MSFSLNPKQWFQRSATPAPAKPKRPQLIGMRSILQAANQGRLESSWGSTVVSADDIIMSDWRRVVARSLSAAENNDYAKKFLAMMQDNVAGQSGFAFHAAIRDPNGKKDDWASDAIDNGFKEWSKRENFSVEGNMSRAAAERLWVRTLGIYGEAIAIKRYGVGPWGFALRLMDPNSLDVDHNVNPTTPGGPFVRFGIEFSGEGRPLGYWFNNETPLYGAGYSRTRFRVDAKDVIHQFNKELINQRRGLPMMRTALWRLNMLHGFQDAAIVNARAGAAKMGFFRDPDADPDEGENLPMSGEPGEFVNIGNREFINYNPQFPTDTYGIFVKDCLRGISSGIGTSYNGLANDLEGVNYSSIRQGALDERESWKGLQERTIEEFCMPVYEAWLEYSLLAGKLTINGKPLKLDRIEKYKQVEFNGRRWTWVDPEKEVNAHEKAIKLGISSRQKVIRENSGDDPWAVWDELSEETKWLAEQGVPLDGKTTESRAAEDLKMLLDAIGVGVRAGVITPSKELEESARRVSKLPAMSAEAIAAWAKDKGVRKPITLMQEGQQAGGFGAAGGGGE